MRNRTGGAAEVAVSETGGAYNSGQRGTTDAFASCFWWADLLGSLAKHEHAMGCRQALTLTRTRTRTLTRTRTRIRTLTLTLTLTPAVVNLDPNLDPNPNPDLYLTLTLP